MTQDEVERIADGLVAIAAEAHTRHFNPGLFEMDPPRFEDADDCFVALLEEAKRLRAAIASLPPKNGSEGVEKLLAKVAPMFPITTHDTPDYAEVHFGNGEGHSSQAMTMNPDHWNALNELFAVLKEGASREG